MKIESKLGFWSIVLLTINSIVGSGIFLSPGNVAKQCGSLAPYVYICAAVLAIVLALTFASASKYTTESGSAYAYVRIAFGDYTGLYVGITRLITASITFGVTATGVIKTTFQILGYPLNEITFVRQTIGFIVFMLILFIINFMGTGVLKWASNISTIGKVTALVIAIVAGIIIVLMTGENHIAEIDTFVDVSGLKIVPDKTVSNFVLAIVSALYAFAGFEAVASGTKDMSNPEKDLPRAIPIGICIVAIVYFGIIETAMIIDPITLVTSPSAVALADIYKNPIIHNIIVLGALVSMFGISLTISFHTPRLLEAMANQQQVPSIFAKRNRRGVPINAYIIISIFAIVIPMAFSYDMNGIMIIATITRFVQFVLVPIAVIKFYKGKTKYHIVENVNRNFFTDVIIPCVSLVLAVLLLIEFDWVGSFSTVSVDGITLNYFAIVSMIIGYIIIPVVVFSYAHKHKIVNK